MILRRHHEPPPTPAFTVEPDQLEQLTTEQLLEIVRDSSSDPAEQSLTERLAWRQIALRGSRGPAN